MAKLNDISTLDITPSLMRVLKRGTKGYEIVQFDKITARLRDLCTGLPSVDPIRIAQSTIKNLYDGIPTEELDKISAKVAESYKLIHPDYGILAGRILISNLHKTTSSSFSECIRIIKTKSDMISDHHYRFIMDNAEALDSMIIHANDYKFDYFGYKTIENGYLQKIEEPLIGMDGGPVYQDSLGNIVTEQIKLSARGKPILYDDENNIVYLTTKTYNYVIDRPQYIYMRIAIALYCDQEYDDKLSNIKACYEALSNRYFTHATPTLFNACSNMQQLQSCYLFGVDDSIESIMKAIYNASIISKWAGGIGMHMHNIRPRGSLIRGTNGKSSGLPRQLKIINEVARCWDQGGKRLGAIAIYLEPWHADIMLFLQLKLNQGAETERARDLFYALWIPDLFIKRAMSRGNWSLFGENAAPGLSDVYDGMEVCTLCGHCENPAFEKVMPPELLGKLASRCESNHIYQPRDVFTELYTFYENEGVASYVVSTDKIMNSIFEMQRESGTPYICFKDIVNRSSNQKGIGTVKSSNLCTEIVQVSDHNSYACCTLASINLKQFLTDDMKIDHEKLHQIVRMTTRNLDNIIDINKYPVEECIDNSKQYRPIGIGIQSLAEVFMLMRIPFLSKEAEKIDLEIAETMYHAALTESCILAQQRGKFKDFEKSPAARGELQFHMWMKNQSRLAGPLSGIDPRTSRYNWDELTDMIRQHGLRNSLLTAHMPTVTTSQIMGNLTESFEPLSSNLYTKTTLCGKFTIVNGLLIKHLIELNLWSKEIKAAIVENNGSIQSIDIIPKHVRDIYLTVWEMKQADIMYRAALRLAFIDQSQSLNIHVRDNSNKTLRSVIFHAYKLGLKTGSYYIRTLPGAQAMKNVRRDVPAAVCTKKEDCVSCTS